MPSGSCVGPALVQLAIGLVHAAYLLVARPFEKRLDGWFAGLWAANTVAMSLCAVLIARAAAASEAEAGTTNDAAEGLLGWCVALQSASFFVQPAVAAVWTCVLWWRRRGDDASAPQQTQQPTNTQQQPLLAVPAPSTTTPQPHAAAGAVGSSPAGNNAATTANPPAGSTGPVSNPLNRGNDQQRR